MIPLVAVILFLPSGRRASQFSGSQSNRALAFAASEAGDKEAAGFLSTPRRHATAASASRKVESLVREDTYEPPGSPLGVVLEHTAAGPDGDGETAVGSSPASFASDEQLRQRPTFFEELRQVLVQPLYMAIVLGYAGYTAVLAGIGSFGPTFVYGLGLGKTPEASSFLFGVAVSLAGAIGTPLGGYLLDRGVRMRKAVRLIARTFCDARRAALPHPRPPPPPPLLYFSR